MAANPGHLKNNHIISLLDEAKKRWPTIPKATKCPDFCWRRTSEREGPNTLVILAQDGGIRPSFAEGKLDHIRTRFYDPKGVFCYETMKIENLGWVIVGLENSGTATGAYWRCWHGVQAGFDSKPVAFPLTSFPPSSPRSVTAAPISSVRRQMPVPTSQRHANQKPIWLQSGGNLVGKIIFNPVSPDPSHLGTFVAESVQSRSPRPCIESNRGPTPPRDPAPALALKTPSKRPRESLDDDKSLSQDAESTSQPVAHKRLRVGGAEGVNLPGTTSPEAQTSKAECIFATNHDDDSVPEGIITSAVQDQGLCDSQILGDMIAMVCAGRTLIQFIMPVLKQYPYEHQSQDIEHETSSAQPVETSDEASIGELKDEAEENEVKARAHELEEETEGPEALNGQPDTATDRASGRCSMM
ncbi:MAG: hypothetical protein Q9209_006828 [Squamulea sp. 1 TL-2023]